MDDLQFHTDQALIQRQLCEASTARAQEIREHLVTRLHCLYQNDHSMAASACYAADDAVTLALHGLFDKQTPIAHTPAWSLMDRLLLHADPMIFDDQTHPAVAAYRAALEQSNQVIPEAMDPLFVDGQWPVPEGYEAE